MQRAFCIEWNYREFEKICRNGEQCKKNSRCSGKSEDVIGKVIKEFK